MRKFLKILFLCGGIIISAFSCEENDELECYTGQVIVTTCGGTVIQFIDTNKIIGEEWSNQFTTPVLSYENCVLVGNLPEEKSTKGQIIYFSFKEVESFTNGNFCDIGGLPENKIEIIELFENNCSNN